MDSSQLTRLGTELSQADVKCLKLRKALRVSSQNILLAKLVQIDLDMKSLNQTISMSPGETQGPQQEWRYEEEKIIFNVFFFYGK